MDLKESPLSQIIKKTNPRGKSRSIHWLLLLTHITFWSPGQQPEAQVQGNDAPETGGGGGNNKLRDLKLS